jgi:UDP-4-amino-4,6-dideoxy-N-acetyl-beta-L-altrosamine transaminase
MIPYGRQSIADADIAAVVEVLRSDWLTQGPTIERFERTVADYCGITHGVAVNSATSALHIACMALDVGPGDTLWTVPNTFVASANCALYCGASVDFVDVDPQTSNISVPALRAKLEEAARTGRLPKVLVPVHYSGRPCDMRAIGELKRQYGFAVIEDASHAIGARDEGKPVGACLHSDIAVFSFHPVKIVTTAEGGMAMTANATLAERMARLRTHGITRDPAHMQGASDGPWYYQQIELGYNYRLTDVHAALGIAQMQRVDDFVRRRRDLAARYDAALADIPQITRPPIAANDTSAWHLYVIRVPAERRAAVFAELRAARIGVNVHYIPVHLQPYYVQRFAFAAGAFPEAERHYAEAISLPMFPDLDEPAQDHVIATLRLLLG